MSFPAVVYFGHGDPADRTFILEIFFMGRFLKKYPVVLSLTLICLLFAAVTCFYNGMYDLFAFHSSPVYIWQYFSGTFMHGSKGAPLWFYGSTFS